MTTFLALCLGFVLGNVFMLFLISAALRRQGL